MEEGECCFMEEVAAKKLCPFPWTETRPFVTPEMSSPDPFSHSLSSLDLKKSSSGSVKNSVNWPVNLVYWYQNLRNIIEKGVNPMRNLIIVIDVMLPQPILLRAVWFHCCGGREVSFSSLGVRFLYLSVIFSFWVATGLIFLVATYF